MQTKLSAKGTSSILAGTEYISALITPQQARLTLTSIFATRRLQVSGMFAVRHHVNIIRSRRLTVGRSLWHHDLANLLSPRPPPWRCFSAGGWSAAKRVSKKQTKELKQGAIQGEPLPPVDKEELRQDSLSQVVKNCMRKFPTCVVLTRVGNFYEVRLSPCCSPHLLTCLALLRAC